MAKSSIQERKVRVNYLPAESSEHPKEEEEAPNGIVCYKADAHFCPLGFRFHN